MRPWRPASNRANPTASRSSAEAAKSFDFEDFNRGDYYGAVQDKVSSETISKVLYPNDEQLGGKRLRLEQQYFFAACSIKDMLGSFDERGNKVPISGHRRPIIELQRCLNAVFRVFRDSSRYSHRNSYPASKPLYEERILLYTNM